MAASFIRAAPLIDYSLWCKVSVCSLPLKDARENEREWRGRSGSGSQNNPTFAECGTEEVQQHTSFPLVTVRSSSSMLLSPPLVFIVSTGKGQGRDKRSDQSGWRGSKASDTLMNRLSGWMLTDSRLSFAFCQSSSVAAWHLHSAQKNERGDGEYQLGDRVWQRGEISASTPMRWCQSGERHEKYQISKRPSKKTWSWELSCIRSWHYP